MKGFYLIKTVLAEPRGNVSRSDCCARRQSVLSQWCSLRTGQLSHTGSLRAECGEGPDASRWIVIVPLLCLLDLNLSSNHGMIHILMKPALAHPIEIADLAPCRFPTCRLPELPAIPKRRGPTRSLNLGAVPRGNRPAADAESRAGSRAGVRVDLQPSITTILTAAEHEPKSDPTSARMAQSSSIRSITPRASWYQTGRFTSIG